MASPVVVTVLLSHPSLLVLPPVSFVVGNIPTVLVDVPPDLRLYLLRLEKRFDLVQAACTASFRMILRKHISPFWYASSLTGITKRRYYGPRSLGDESDEK